MKPIHDSPILVTGAAGTVGAVGRTIVELLRQRHLPVRALVRRYERPVYSVLMRVVRSAEDAEDLVQETFVKVFRALDRYDPERPFSAWLFTIASRLLVVMVVTCAVRVRIRVSALGFSATP